MLPQKDEVRVHIINVNKAMSEYYQTLAKQIKLLHPDPQVSNFYHPLAD